MGSTDLTSFLPARNRDKTIDTLIKNLFNRHLSKSDIVTLFGYVGDNVALNPGEVQIKEESSERQINQLIPFIYTEHSSEKKIFSWTDLLNAFKANGINPSYLKTWLKSTSYNFVPPIDFDKFCNFQEYFWVGEWILKNPSISYAKLGIRPASEVKAKFNSWKNTTVSQEYYVIERSGDSDWSYCNLWVHRDDVIKFISENPSLGYDNLVQASRPIIEYRSTISLNEYFDENSAPSDKGQYSKQFKKSKNQLPLFDLYLNDGTHANLASSIFFYQESPNSKVDSIISRRLKKDENNDYIFGHSLVAEDGYLYFYRETTQKGVVFNTIWAKGETATIKYQKNDTTGTIIDHDKFVNYKNYFWTGIESKNKPFYNKVSKPEYSVIETGGKTDWSIHNHWVHVSKIARSKLKSYIQAEFPIIEFNKTLEAELISTTKLKFNELPRFKHYLKTENSFEQVSSNKNLNDAYLNGLLFARMSEIPLESQSAFKSNSELYHMTLEHNGEQYVQGLVSGVYYSGKDGVNYGYKTRILDVGFSNVSVLVDNVTNTIPQIIKFTKKDDTSFDVYGSVSGNLGSVEQDVKQSILGIDFIITGNDVGIGEFAAIEVISYVYERDNLYVKLGENYRTVDTPSKIFNEVETEYRVDANPEDNDGEWVVPPQMEWNMKNETLSSIKQGDIYYHLISIINEQPGLIGSSSGNNNWRLIEKDYGVGGTIKQYDGDFSLLVSLMIQEGITVNSLIDFLQTSYQELSTNVKQFVENKLPELITSGLMSNQSKISADKQIIEMFKSYISGKSITTDTSESVIDDIVTSPFYDSTSSIFNVPVTLPYLGLVSKVKPTISFDYTLNIDVLQHHDGHKSALQKVSKDFTKRIVVQTFKRSDGSETPGIIGGFDAPVRPYKNQFWYKTTTNELLFFSVVSDTGELLDAEDGSYSYDREKNVLWYKDGGSWGEIGGNVSDLKLPWKTIDFDLILQNLELNVETELYNKCPDISSPINQVEYITSPLFNSLMKTEFENFGVKYGTTDVYSIAYDPDNAFTWNYSSYGKSTWYQVYQSVYGTPRPDIEPWVAIDYTEKKFISELIDLGLIPSTSTKFDVTMWPSIATFMKSKNVLKLSVDVDSGQLIPPYAFGHPESIFNEPPVSLNEKYTFGSNGPIESFWKSTLDYLYSLQKTFFKINPLDYVSNTWGYKSVETNGYVFNQLCGYKLGPSDFKLHGEKLTINKSVIIDSSIVKKPKEKIEYVFKFVHRKDGIFQVTSSSKLVNLPEDRPLFIKLTGEIRKNVLEYKDKYISLKVKCDDKGFFWGDSIVVNVNESGEILTDILTQSEFKCEGLNQAYVQYNRIYGEDTLISVNKSLMSGWDVKLGYRFGGMVNTDSLKIVSQGKPLDENSYSVFVKENKNYSHSWLNSLRVQLVQKGSSTYNNGYHIPVKPKNGFPGDDWVFRVDNFNVRNPVISWYEYDTDGEFNTFVALNGVRTQHEWRRYTTKKSILSYATPFLVTGIQNLVNFIFGYSDYLEDQGWSFNDNIDPLIDNDTGRPTGYQLSVEKFIVQQFSNVDAGSSYIFNPFFRKVWFNTDHGVVAGLKNIKGFEQDSTSIVLDESGKQVSNKYIRVFRQDDQTQFVFDVPVHTMHLLVSEYEHVVLFDNYSVSTLVYDPFIGQRINRMFIEGERQLNFTGRLDFGGHFLLGNKMKKNLDLSIQEIGSLYDTTSRKSESVDRARGILGFTEKGYFSKRGMTKASQFRFWQGMIPNKGTNLAIDAYVNSASYENAKVDEYWAFKIAEYGDINRINHIDMKLQPEDCIGEASYYCFEDSTDIPGIAVRVDQNDETRWKSYSDLNSISYFDADVINETFIIPSHVGQLISVEGVNADIFEIHDTSYVNNSEGYDLVPYDKSPFSAPIKEAYYENGEFENGKFTTPSFERVNSSTIRILSEKLVGRSLKLVAFGPNEKKFSPMSIYDKSANTLVDGSIIWWDPTRKIHNPRAASTIDTDSKVDPAIYNESLDSSKVNKLKSWGNDQVGTVWWNTSNLYWAPYFDEKLFPSMSDRVKRWGALSDVSSINVYEWVKSQVPPSEMKLGVNGEPAIVEYVSRNRTWWHRPVAWKYSDNPVENSRKYVLNSIDTIKVNGSKAILSSAKFDGIKIGMKIAGLVNDKPVGMAIITSLPKYVLGVDSSFECGFLSAEVDLVEKELAYRDNVLGAYSVSITPTSIKMVYANTGEEQSIDYVNTKKLYSFDKFGITLKVLREENFNFVIRSYVDIDVKIDLSETLSNWIVWSDPPTALSLAVKAPYNKFEPIVGDWVKVGSKLNSIEEEIKIRSEQPWIVDSIDYSPYKSTWSDWETIKDIFVEGRKGIANLNKILTFDLSEKDLSERAKVYVNEALITEWETVGNKIVINSTINDGDLVRVKVSGYTPSKKELDFDPESDPFTLIQYKKNYPHVLEVVRDEYDKPSINNYYFWVKNKSTPAKGKKISVKMTENLLNLHDGIYAIPQNTGLKDQVKFKPNRYNALALIGLSSEVKTKDRHYLRITENSSLRDRDENLSLKQNHEEWKLIRVNQLDKIPRILWDKLTDTLTASDSFDTDLPYSAFSLYDERNKSGYRYGLDQGKIMTDPLTAKSIVKYTILNTQLDKYENGKSVPDYITFEGFDSSKLDDYLGTKVSIRKFMSDIWRFAKPNQINEIFFAVLHDAVAKNKELSGIFKTSFISLSDVRMNSR